VAVSILLGEVLETAALLRTVREDAVRTLLARSRGDWSVVDGSIERGILVGTEYQGQRFYVRRFAATRSTPATAIPATP
jgi:hypothetical protein